MRSIVTLRPEARDAFLDVFKDVARTKPSVLRYVVVLMAFYLHLYPFSRKVIEAMDRRIAELDEAVTLAPGFSVGRVQPAVVA